MTVNRESLEKLGRFLLRGLRIGASTVSIVELLRNDWSGGLSAGVAWLGVGRFEAWLGVVVERFSEAPDARPVLLDWRAPVIAA